MTFNQNTKYMILIVQYEKPLSQISILSNIEKLNRKLVNCEKILVYDNSINKSEVSEFENYSYFFSGSNVGTSGAYKYALEYAKNNDIIWLIVFDQDTEITGEKILEVDKYMSNVISKTTGALIPNVFEDGHIISPSIVNIFGAMKKFDKYKNKRGTLTAISSGAILRVDLFNQIFKSLPKKLWLDYVDHWMFLQCQRLGYCLKIIDFYNLEHCLSINDFKNVSFKRLLSIYNGERVFCKHLSLLAFFFWYLKIPIRVSIIAFKTYILPFIKK